MKKLIYLFLLISTVTTTAQTPAKKVSEWDVLDQTFIKLVESLAKKQKQAFLQIALTSVDCPDCPEVDGYTKEGAFLPATIFYEQTSEYFTKSPVYKAMYSKGYRFNSAIIKDYKLPGAQAVKDIKVYDVWVETYAPNQIAKGHQGTAHAFRFIKANGKYRFLGLISSDKQ